MILGCVLVLGLGVSILNTVMRRALSARWERDIGLLPRLLGSVVGVDGIEVHLLLDQRSPMGKLV
jgi:hypothetical protein